MRARVLPILAVTAWWMSVGCQNYDFVYQPDVDRVGVHLRFVVERPSKADILFTIDNSRSMAEEQAALEASIDVLLQGLAPQDTRYRIGITSTDAIGFDTDCQGNEDLYIREDYPGAKGNCLRPEVELRRPHDGALGRLIAAYDPVVLDLNDPNNTLFDDLDFPCSQQSDQGSCGAGCTWDAAARGGAGACVLDCAASTTEDTCPSECFWKAPAGVGDSGMCMRLRRVLARTLPVGPYDHPNDPIEFDFADFPGFKGDAGARWVIDRETIRLEACQACECTEPNVMDDECADGTCDLTCAEEDPCMETCVARIAPRVVEAFFRSNMSGLGVTGQGWEEGLKAASLAIGIDPRDKEFDTEGNPRALTPGGDLTRVPDGANTFLARDETGATVQSSWVRDEALLAVMFVTDEQDCSMPDELSEEPCRFEDGCCEPAEPNCSWVEPLDWVWHPQGSLCYQSQLQDELLPPVSRADDDHFGMADLFVGKKGGSVSRVAVGLIGGVQQVGSHTVGEAVDCAVDATSSEPTSECACLSAQWSLPLDQQECDGWCAFTQDDMAICLDPQDQNPPYCSALAGSRYVQFANAFRRQTFESVCRAEAGQGFGEAMARFAEIATLACFDLNDAVPVGSPPSADLITVRRVSKAEAEAGLEPTVLPQRDRDAMEEGWYLDLEDEVPRICLTGLDRLIGDVYDIFVVTTDQLDYTN